MRGKVWFLGGLAAGFVLGARAGREKYEQIVEQARKVMDHPTVQEAAGVAQAQANRLYSEGKDKLSHTKLGEKLSTDNGPTTSELTSGDTLAATGSTSRSKATGTTTGTTSGTGTNGTNF
jgi:hypothetical protein